MNFTTAEFDFAWFINETIPEGYRDRPFHLMVDCGKTANITARNVEGAEEVNSRFMKRGYKLLPQECPVINSEEIVLHYTSTTYKEWCNG